MTATTTLPDPRTEAIKLGRHPRRSVSIYAAYGKHNTVQTSPDRFKGTPLGRSPIFHAAAMFRLSFRTTAEARRMVDAFHHWRTADDAAYRKWFSDRGYTLTNCNQYICEREARSSFKLPLWIGNEVINRFGKQWLINDLFAAAVSDFGRNTHIDYAVAYAEEVERRTAEAKAIDDAAHATLTAIMSGEAVSVETA